MIQKLVVSFMISFVMRQLEKFHSSLDWDKIKRDLDERIRLMMPGSWFDDEAVLVANTALDMLRSVLEQGDNIKRLLELLTAKNYDDAARMMKEIMLGRLSSVSLSSNETAVKDSLMMV